MAGERKTPASRSGTAATSSSRGASEVDAFLAKVVATPAPVRSQGRARGRLLFIMDATMSRQQTWDQALGMQAQMFEVTADLGGLDVQLAYFRGHGEFKSSGWVGDPRSLARAMSGVQVRGGHTQIRRALRHALREAQAQTLPAVVYVGDCMEEAADDVCAVAGELALHGTRAFMFQEGFDETAESTFREVARLTGGAFVRFDAGAADQLRALLRAAAVYATGGHRQLEAHARTAPALVRQLTHQVR